MLATTTTVLCASCGRQIARVHADTVCSPCRRTIIESTAEHQALLARDRSGIKTAFDSTGLNGVAKYLGTTPTEALDALFSSRLLPFVSERRRMLLHRLVGLSGSSHVAVAEALHISRWTVAAYRHQLGIDRAPASIHGRNS
jgi:hypothetical protein